MSKKSKGKQVNISHRRAFDWRRLRNLIAYRVEAGIAESWAGGGDPADVETLRLRARLAQAQLNAHIEKMRREEGTQ